jgi:quercetin dioxygenase-like cupin family protein
LYKSFAFFLAASLYAQQPLPEGKGKEILDNYCQECHGLDQVTGEGLSTVEWRKTIDRMVKKGASLKPEEIGTLTEYLAAYFGPQKTPQAATSEAATSKASSSKVAIDNDQVKALQVDAAAHVKTKLHEHTVNRVMIYLQAGRQTITYADGRQTVLEWKAGEAKWSPAAGMHVAEIISDQPVTIVELELKKPGNPSVSAAGPLDPVKVDPKHYRVEFENDQVRVLRVRIGPHESTPVHTHALNRVVTYISDQDMLVTTDGKPEQVRHKAGDVSWGTPATHREENVSDRPFEVIAVELKN